MSNPGPYDFTIFAGQTVSMPFFCKNPDGSPINLTGFVASFVAKVSLAAESKVIEKTGMAIVPLEGRIELALTDEETAAIEADDLIYTCKITRDGAVYPLFFGKITISREVF